MLEWKRLQSDRQSFAWLPHPILEWHDPFQLFSDSNYFLRSIEFLDVRSEFLWNWEAGCLLPLVVIGQKFYHLDYPNDLCSNIRPFDLSSVSFLLCLFWLLSFSYKLFYLLLPFSLPFKHSKISFQAKKYHQFTKVECVFPMVAVSHYGPNDQRENAPHFSKKVLHLTGKWLEMPFLFYFNFFNFFDNFVHFRSFECSSFE